MANVSLEEPLRLLFLGRRLQCNDARATSTPAGEAEIFDAVADADALEPSTNGANARTAANGADASDTLPGTVAADILSDLNLDQPIANDGETQGEPSRANRNASAVDSDSPGQSAASNNAAADNQAFENGEGGDNASQPGNQPDSAEIQGAEAASAVGAPGVAAGQSGQANGQGEEGTNDPSAEHAIGGATPPEEEETTEVIGGDDTLPPPPVVPVPNIGQRQLMPLHRAPRTPPRSRLRSPATIPMVQLIVSRLARCPPTVRSISTPA